MTELRLRQAARAIVLDPDDRILLVGFEWRGTMLWETPGGGVDEGETLEQAARRELFEETGLEAFELGPIVWTRTHVGPFGEGRWDGQSESFYLVRASTFVPAPRLSAEALRAEGMVAVHWWELDELEATDAVLVPSRLPALVRELLLHGPPAEPLDVGG
jgi:8-oxo-dGTP pyrophosphatase MutT (NUDIX family)